MNAAPRPIWLCADDYGIAPGVNTAIRDLVTRGHLNATSAMVAAPALTPGEARALDALNERTPQAAIGLHLVLTAPFKPLSEGFRPLRDGAFPSLAALMAAAFLRRLDAAALRREIDRQLDAFGELFGRMPDFIDGHQHVHLFPQIREALIERAKARASGAWLRQCGRAQPRLDNPKALFLDLISRGFARQAAAQGLRTNPAFAGAYTLDQHADVAALFAGFFDRLPAGGVVMCHPGFVDAELARLDPLTALREREYALLAGDAFPDLLARHGVALAPAAAR
jgi:hypothetical protein